MNRSCKIMIICICMSLWGLTACTRQEGNNISDVMAGGTNIENTESAAVNTENADENTEDGTGNTGYGSENAGNEPDVQQDTAIEDSNRNILAACEGTTITQIIESSGGNRISVDAEVDVEGISRVSCYRYVPRLLTDDLRKALLKKKFPAEIWDVNAAAVYDEKEDTWQFVTPRGERWIYRVSDSGIPGEQILNLERIDIDMNYVKETKVSPVLIPTEAADELLLEVTGCVPREIEQFGQDIIGLVAETDIYPCSYIHICEIDGERPYAKAVYKPIIDGMPVTAWHNFTTVTAEKSIFPVKVWGAFFSTEEIGLDKPILSVEEAVSVVREQIGTVQIQEQVSVAKITLEYLAVISPEGEPEIVPVWRFWMGEDEMERIRMCENILAVNSMSGELIWEERGSFTE